MNTTLKNSFLIGLLLFARVATAQDVADLVERTMPSTVNIQVTKEGQNFPMMDVWEDFFGFPQRQRLQEISTLGSGFFIDAEGHIVTNHHVVDNATRIKVINHKGDEMDAFVVGSHADSDLAVIKIQDPSDFSFHTSIWGDSDKARIGSPVVAIGNPYGLSGTVTAGIVSARGRDIGAGKYDNFIQTDAAIDQGNSGGPLLNMKGEVIGINSMMVMSREGQKIGLALAIPSNWARTIVDQILEYGEPRIGAIGVSMESITPQLKETLNLPDRGGALVTSVIKDSPAEAGGILRGDVILKFGNSEIATARDLIRAVAQVPVDTVVDVNVWRQLGSVIGESEGMYENLEIRVGLRDSVLGIASEPVSAIGVKVALISSLTQQMKENFGLENETEGVVITEVISNSPADVAGLLAGDSLLVISGFDVSTPEEVQSMFTNIQNDWTVLIWYKRLDTVQYAILEVNRKTQ